MTTDQQLMEMQVKSLLEDLTSAIQKVFGFNPYPWQLEVFLKVLIGRQDIIVSAGTAEGKSLCYQGMALFAFRSHSSCVLSYKVPHG